MAGRGGGHRRKAGQTGAAGAAYKGTVRVPAGSGSGRWGQENPVPEWPLQLCGAQQQLVSGASAGGPPGLEGSLQLAVVAAVDGYSASMARALRL